MTTFTSPRLILEAQTIAHADVLFEGLSDPAHYLYIPTEPPQNVEALRAEYTRVLQGPAEGSELWLNWAVRETATGTYVGFIETSVMPGDHAHLAWFIFTPHQGKGYAKEACQAVIAHIVPAHGLTHLVTEMDTRNTGSQRLAESLGYVFTGEIKDADFFKGATSHEFHYRLDLAAPAK